MLTDKIQQSQNEVGDRNAEAIISSPAVDIIEKNSEYVILADMPGVNENNLSVTLEKGVLTLEGRIERQIPEGMTAVYAECDEGAFKRSFTLNNHEIDFDQIRASIRNGIARLVLPKVVPVQRKIPVNAGA